ncbi:DMT family transporter [Bradyrhizobium lablabi]|uniref:DMT family transporter n=1 Tax=Bradyrhizobium lablabi TaxID=722472 RepID=UPI002898A82A|nr:DMT family transporter [Bradyrhizobium lablabi]
MASTFLMGSSFVAGKILLQGGFSPMILVGWRFLIAALAALPALYLDSDRPLRALCPPSLSARDAGVIALIGLLQTAAVMGLLFLAMKTISASTAAILLFTNPIWVAVLGFAFLGESLRGARILGLVLGVVGVALAIGPSADMLNSFATVRGEAIGIASALCWATATIINKKANLPIGSWALSFWQMLIGAIAILAVAYALGERWPAHVTISQWSWFIWLSIPASTGSFGLWFVALSKGGATRTSGYLFLAPLFTVILSFVIMGSTLTWLQLGGGVTIGLALWLVNREIPAKTARERKSQVLAEGEP